MCFCVTFCWFFCDWLLREIRILKALFKASICLFYLPVSVSSSSFFLFFTWFVLSNIWIWISNLEIIQLHVVGLITQWNTRRTWIFLTWGPPSVHHPAPCLFYFFFILSVLFNIWIPLFNRENILLHILAKITNRNIWRHLHFLDIHVFICLKRNNFIDVSRLIIDRNPHRSHSFSNLGASMCWLSVSVSPCFFFLFFA